MSSDEFEKAIKVTDLNIIGVFKKVDYVSDFISKRVFKNNKEIIQPHMTSIYIRYYNGPIQFVDGESSGIEVFSLGELKEEIEQKPEKFTEDIKIMVEKYEKFLVQIS